MKQKKGFQNRKLEQFQFALDQRSQTNAECNMSCIHLIHEAIPDFDFDEISLLQKRTLGISDHKPLLISSMVGGTDFSLDLNILLATCCEQKGWFFGVGSQRKQINNLEAKKEWLIVRKKAPNVKIFSNLGITQLRKTPINKIQDLVDTLEATGIIIHTNPLQEVIQPEGSPNFRDAMKYLERLISSMEVPVIVKEVGCGISKDTMKRLSNIGVSAIDIAGFGGTHWGRVEGLRYPQGSLMRRVAGTFRNWGIPTVESLLNGIALPLKCELWASGGVRNGLDVLKFLAMGANVVGIAAPILDAAQKGEGNLVKALEKIEIELKIGLFCTGSQNPDMLREKKVWIDKGTRCHKNHHGRIIVQRGQ